MKNAKKKLRQIKKKLACWDKNVGGKCSATPCSSSTPSTGSSGDHGDED